MPEWKARLSAASKDPIWRGSWGMITAGGGLGVLFTTILVTAVTGGAVLAGLGAVGLAYKSYRVVFPRKRLQATDKLSDKDGSYEYWDCHFSRVALLGLSGAGKTTLLDFYNDSARAVEGSTTNRYYLIVELDRKDKIFTFIGDARGESDEDRRDMISLTPEADMLIFFVDHGNTRTDTTRKDLDRMRLNQHHTHVKELITLARKDNSERSILVLFNKRDLWETGPDAQEIRDWISEAPRSFSKSLSLPSGSIEVWPFSANNAQDRVRLAAYTLPGKG